MRVPTVLSHEPWPVTGEGPAERERNEAAIASARLAAIVASSDDAIVSKSLDGTVVSWNAGAERIFGYSADEMIGRPIVTIIPNELRYEEDQIIARLKRGERIDHFETVRCRKDGTRINLSITVSPVRDASGRVVGASKVARDITDRKQADELQRLLFDELNHRVKNMLATIQAIASQSLRKSASPTEFVNSFNGRVQALSRAHDLLVESRMRGADVMEIVREQVMLDSGEGARIHVGGPMIALNSRDTVQIGLVLHELATNARKYGALKHAQGMLSITWSIEPGEPRALKVVWRESGLIGVAAPERPGFGTTLIKRTLTGAGGHTEMQFDSEGLLCTVTLPLVDAPTRGPDAAHDEPETLANPSSQGLVGKRVLVVEDEPLIALDVEEQLSLEGCQVVGPVASVEAANRLILSGGCDLALLDANLAGERVDSVAHLLRKLSVPFVFTTGYGPEALPRGFSEIAILSKPYGPNMLKAALAKLLAPEGARAR